MPQSGLPPKIAHLAARGQNVEECTNKKFQHFAKIKNYYYVRKLCYFYGTIEGISDYIFKFLIVPANCRAKIYTKISKFLNTYFLEEIGVFLTL